MSGNHSLLRQKMWRFIDHTSEGSSFSAVQSFAIDDTLCQSVGTGESSAVARAWIHEQTVVLGIQDSRMPFLESGISYLHSQGYQAIVRNSGGLAVVLDKGVLNLTLVFSEKEHRISINQGYEAMVEFIRNMFKDYGAKIEAKEIVGSYCPGSYDLSIGGKKFAGISQRRVRNGVAVQIYLCINESGSKRAAMIKEFYRLAKGGQETKFQYPDIHPEVMASLTELLQDQLTVEDVMVRIRNTAQLYGESVETSKLTAAEEEQYTIYFNRMIERNAKLTRSAE